MCIPYACLFISRVMTNIHEREELGYVACYIYAVNGVEGQARASKLLYRLSWFTRSSACVQYMSALLLLHWQKFKTASSRKLGQCYGMSQLSQVCLKALSQVLTLYISYFHSDVSTWKNVPHRIWWKQNIVYILWNGIA